MGDLEGAVHVSRGLIDPDPLKRFPTRARPLSGSDLSFAHSSSRNGGLTAGEDLREAHRPEFMV